MTTRPVSSAFAPTRWTLVLRARGDTPESRAALSELCEAYYQPVIRFLRCEGRDEETTREVAQEFFARVLGGSGFQAADPERGRFRSYLLGALKHFLAERRAWEQRQKRGTRPESLSAGTDTSPGCEVPDPAGCPPDAWFDREWALAVMDRALARLAAEFRGSGKHDQFELLKLWLAGETPCLSQAGAASRLGMSEGALKVAIHRLRRRFRELVKTDIAQTLHRPEDVQDELHHLIAALS